MEDPNIKYMRENFDEIRRTIQDFSEVKTDIQMIKQLLIGHNNNNGLYGDFEKMKKEVDKLKIKLAYYSGAAGIAGAVLGYLLKFIIKG